MAKYIFLGVFSLSCIFQVIWWNEQQLVDWNIWADQAEYVQTNNPEQLNAAKAYGHPGGPVVEGTIFIHNISGATFDDSVLIFLAIFDSILVASIATLCYLLRRNSLWWLAAGGVLVVNRMIQYVTPPSLVVSFLVTLLFLLTVYYYENKDKAGLYVPILWSLVAGLSVATRADIGAVVVATCAVSIVALEGIKKTLVLLIGAFISFCLFDPFMWFMPIRHISDLVSKVIYHYADFTPTPLSLYKIVNISSLALVSVFLAITFLILRKKIRVPIPPLILCTFLIMTVFLYTIFLTARYQAERYFVPLIFIWETLLPLFIFYLISGIDLDFIKTERRRNQIKKGFEIFTIIILAGFHFYIMFQFIWTNILYA